jgi:xanthine dehydrogenase accessory factor
MIVVGDAPIARALEGLARAAGYDVLRCDPLEAEPHAGDAAVIVASHGSGEEPVLAKALSEGVGYVALVCSAVRGEAVRETLDLPPELRRQLHAPAGLAIGARSPAEVAIAILAELVASEQAQPAEAVRLSAGAKTVGPAHAETAIDPVCGMEVVAAHATHHLDVDGERVFFCCEQCRSTYAERHAVDVAGR